MYVSVQYVACVCMYMYMYIHVPIYFIYFYINNLFLHELRYNIVDQCSFMYSLENILNRYIIIIHYSFY